MDTTTSTNLLTAFETALTNVQTEVFGYVETALPVALAIMGTMLAVGIGIAFFKRIAN